MFAAREEGVAGSQHSERAGDKGNMFSVALDVSALDDRFKAHAIRGTGRYVQELQNFFKRENPSGLEVLNFLPHGKEEGVLERAIKFLPFGRMTARQQILYPLQLSNARWMKRNIGQRVDCIHYPAHIDAPSWSGCRYMVTVLDLIPVVLADLYRADRPDWRFRLARALELRAIRNASLVLAISENTANDVHQILGVPRERIVVTPLGVDDRFFLADRKRSHAAIRRKSGIPEDRSIVLYVGGIDQRKNVHCLLRGFRKVLDCQRSIGGELPVLVMAGEIRSDLQFAGLERELQQLDLEEDVIMTGFVSDEDLISLYAASRVLFFPSLYEGFGLTPLEAMAAGTPVVSSNTSAMPEVLGQAALFFDPEKEDTAVEKLGRVLNDNSLAMDLSVQGRKQARQFSWKRTGESTVAAYEQLFRGLNAL